VRKKTKADKLIEKLIDTIRTSHLDMGGKHKYTLTDKSHPIITKVKEYYYLHWGEKEIEHHQEFDELSFDLWALEQALSYIDCLDKVDVGYISEQIMDLIKEVNFKRKEG
jgi:hypothetical protein